MVSAFETQNGESVVVYYNPDCTPYDEEEPAEDNTTFHNLKYVCANFVYDLNQERGPNAMGKDIGFMTVFYASDPVVVSPIPGARDGVCSSNERIPTVNEGVSLVLNQNLLGNLETDVYTSGRVISGSDTYYFTVSHELTSDALENGAADAIETTASTSPTENPTSRCLKR